MLRTILLTFAFVLAVDYFVGWRGVLAPWARLSPAFVAATAGLLLFTYVIRTLRIYRYFRLRCVSIIAGLGSLLIPAQTRLHPNRSSSTQSR